MDHEEAKRRRVNEQREISFTARWMVRRNSSKAMRLPVW
ncbi:hypothetical protein QWZ10_13145 [Paracoccus cavernae]|uniref:Uncharacterized protein n=1 Tax=Paracoccus cavernae TaxID=1571207 RepID=A0ABT8D6Q3_9RHOB|nr:hypothetical protein [Paracoccus cavernae]